MDTSREAGGSNIQTKGVEMEKFKLKSRVALDFDRGTVVSVSDDGKVGTIRWDSDGGTEKYDASTFFGVGEGWVMGDKELDDDIVEILVDRSCEMARVSLNGNCVMEGNFWDFHPGCHGITDYGDFRGYSGLATAISMKLYSEGKKPKIVNGSYNYLAQFEN